MTIQELFDLRGHTALVTGGAGRLGSQISLALAEAGANVVIGGRNLTLCEDMSTRIRALGVDSVGVRLDVTEPEEVARALEVIKERFASLDILVNNAGGARRALLDQATMEDWQAIIDLNLTGTFLCSQAAAKIMIEQRRGRIINIASIYGVVGVDQRLYERSPEKIPGSVPYTASKGGVINLTRDMAVYLAKHNIRVNAISPGSFPSKVDENDEFQQRYCERTPLGRMGGADDLKGAVVYFASHASDYVTGQNLMVDGGWTAW